MLPPINPSSRNVNLLSRKVRLCLFFFFSPFCSACPGHSTKDKLGALLGLTLQRKNYSPVHSIDMFSQHFRKKQHTFSAMYMIMLLSQSKDLRMFMPSRSDFASVESSTRSDPARSTRVRVPCVAPFTVWLTTYTWNTCKKKEFLSALSGFNDTLLVQLRTKWERLLRCLLLPAPQ